MVKNTVSICSLFLMIFFLSNHIMAQPKDVLGWREARWRMTEEQILTAFKGEAFRFKEEIAIPGGDYAIIGIENINLRGENFTVRFIMDGKTRKLKRVSFRPVETWNLGDKVTLATFKNLEQLLVEKYGKPAYRDDKGTPDYNIRVKGYTNLVTKWLFPTTSIELSYMEDRQTSMRNLFFSYQPNIDKDRDKL